MRFIGDIIVFLLIIAGVGYGVLKSGVISFQADAKPSSLEIEVAMNAVDASAARRVSDLKNPVEASDENILTGVKIYKSNCMGCHGGADPKDNTFGGNFYPPAPQFIDDKPDMSDNENFYLVKYGIRWTGMPAWHKMLSDIQIWQVTTFLSHMDKLPATADAEWKKKN